ncbi:MAG: manganese efflux pump MntP family protein [Bacteroidales bacterium]|nr:manganese efflux pump MntP family protein [Bacteroidales bacterium]
MSIIEFIILSVGLCFDTLAISIVSGPFIKTRKVASFSYFAFMMAIIQAAFILAGLFSGKALVDYIQQFDHWIAFGLLTFLGVRMIMQKEEDGESDDSGKSSVLRFGFLVMSGVATSIDALFVGFAMGLGIKGNDLWILPLTVFLVTAATAVAGLTLGHMLSRWSSRFNIIGGCILILIGLRILITSLLEG